MSRQHLAPLDKWLHPAPVDFGLEPVGEMISAAG
jgi:hypothetical protein